METEEERRIRIELQKARIDAGCRRIGECMKEIHRVTDKMEKSLAEKKL